MASYSSRSRQQDNNNAPGYETVIVIPPDGGWGWVVVAAAFLSNMITNGSLYTFGIFLDDIASTFDVPKTKVAIITSALSGFYFVSGPFVCALTNTIGFRVVGLAGGFGAALSIYATSQSTILWPIFITHGFFCGIAFGMVYVPSILAIGFYFEKWRALATSIAVTGSSVGIVAIPQVIKIAMDGFTWRFQFCLISLTFVLVGLCALTYRPLKAIEFKDIPNLIESRSRLTMTQETDDGTSLGSKFSSYRNKSYPTAADVLKDSDVLRQLSQSTIGMSTSVLTSNAIVLRTSMTSRSTKTSREFCGYLETIPEEDDEPTDCSPCCNKSNCVCCFDFCKKNTHHPIARPMYRDDIFYGASLNKLTEYNTAIDKSSTFTSPSTRCPTFDYHLSVTRVSTQKTNQGFCPDSVKRTLVTMMDLSILKSKPFLCLAISGFFTTLGLYLPFIFIIERSLQKGISSEKAYFLLSLMGMANGVGRILCGILASIPQSNALLVTWLMILTAGLSTLISSISNSYELQIGFVCIYGSSIACFSAIKTIVIVDLVKLENLTTGLGITLIFQGLAAFISMPMVSVIINASNNDYDAAFYFGGSVITISALFLIAIDRNKKKETVTTNI